MKRLMVPAAVVAILLFNSSAYAVCQKCNNDNTLNAMCWTVPACQTGATMGACVVRETFDASGQVTNRYCDSEGSSPGLECNGSDPSCSAGGGGGADQPPEIQVANPCMLEMGSVCPAECQLCVYHLPP